jgi:hypothetical protein
MSFDPLSSPVVVDGVVSEEKVAELLALQTEYPELDHKATTSRANWTTPIPCN